MTFAWPHVFWVLLVPAVLLWWEVTHRRRTASTRRPKILRAEAGVRSLQLSSFAERADTPGSRPRIWLAVGFALCLVALARPQWGRLEEPIFDQSREILLAVDLSRSMLAPDVKPSRLDRTKLLIQSLLEKLAGERVGLVVFAGTSFLQAPLSADYEILREFLPALDPEFLPQGGSNYDAMLETALQGFGASNSADRFLIVLSDGEATDDNWKTRAEELKKKNIRVIALGVGTEAGAMLPDGAGGFIKDERGAVVLSKLETSTLQELARSTNGVYRDASAWIDLAALVTETIETGRKGDFVEKNTVRLAERFQWPLALGLWCLFVSFCYEFPVRPKVRSLQLPSAQPVPPPLPVAGKAAALALLCSLGALAYPVPGFAAATLAKKPDPASEPPALAKIVGRLAARENRTARDWAELGRETVNWGSRLQTENHPVPEGPIRDALSAVELGRKLDASAADWKRLREDLEALLKQPDEPKPPQEQQQDENNQEKSDDPQQKSDHKKQDKSKKDQQKSQQKQDNKQENDPSPKDEQSSGQEPDKKENPKDPGESAFGDMNKKEESPPPPPPDNGTQKVGGAPEKKEEAPQAADPALALPLQKLEQLRNQDSPAQLFQLIEGEKKPGTKKPGKDW